MILKTDPTCYVKDWDAPIFNGLAEEDVQIWLCDIRFGLKQRRVPPAAWVAVATNFLGAELREVMVEAEQKIASLGPTDEVWNWDRFTCALILIHDKVKKDALEGKSFIMLVVRRPFGTRTDSKTVGAVVARLRQDHPVATAAAGIGLITLGGITVGPAVLVGTLNLLGFSASGIVSGSIAAMIQSAVYGGYVASGSAFALAQSAAAGGIVVASVPVQAACASAMGLGAWLGFGRNRPADGSDPGANDNPISLKDERSAGMGKKEELPAYKE
ncbi:hypothetical protein C8R47DRAFT_813418 [Mycena vitilis]|nr:hypothetical protein C8R47DRAFT_813418 [Mycena vitilis]